jgi:hypothetical protein
MRHSRLSFRAAIYLLVLAWTRCAFRTSALSTPIVTCSSSIELERAISFYCKPGDSVLELGAQLSDASRQLCQTIGPTGKANLVDVERSEAKSGRCTHRDVQAFSSLNGVHLVDLPTLDDWKECLFQNDNNEQRQHYNVILVDLGHMIGNDLYLTTLSLTTRILSETKTNPPRVVLVKSKSLASLARRLIPAQQLVEGHRRLALPGNNNTLARSNNEPYIIASVGVGEYRKVIPFTVQKGDVVLEVGCHFGRSTHLLHEAASSSQGDDNNGGGYCIGVDIGPKIIQNAKSQYPSILFAVGDAWRSLQLLKLRRETDGGILGYDVVYADIGGLSGAHGSLEALALLDALANALEPRCIVIKSLCMKRLASQLRPFSEVWARLHS